MLAMIHSHHFEVNKSRIGAHSADHFRTLVSQILMSQVNIYPSYMFNPRHNFHFLLCSVLVHFILACMHVCLWMHEDTTSMWEALVWFLASSENYNAGEKINDVTIQPKISSLDKRIHVGEANIAINGSNRCWCFTIVCFLVEILAFQRALVLPY